MIWAVVVACFVGAIGCVAYALLTSWPTAARAVGRSRAEGQQVAALSIALLLVVLAAAVAVVDDKVGSADVPSAATAGAQASGPPAARGTSLVYPLEAAEADNFAGSTRTTYGTRREALCLVNYYDRHVDVGAGRSYKWWTSCDDADGFSTVAEVRDALALPPAWGARNAVAIACVPARARFGYVSGPAAAVRTSRHTYAGGGLQFRVLRFDTEWIVARQALGRPRAPLPPLDRRSCPR
jgi:hypothetical protein